MKSLKYRDLIRMLEEDGWREVIPRRGRHVIKFRHPVKPGVVVVGSKHSQDFAPGTLNKILKDAGLK